VPRNAVAREHTELAALYGVSTRRLNEQLRRHRGRFSAEFLFELTTEEFANLKSHFATSSCGGRRKVPFASTELGSIQTATILNSPRSVKLSLMRSMSCLTGRRH
jgi:hypothetical protein